MKHFYASYFNENDKRKGQLKIQEMAFVLIAIMIFFAIIALFYFSIRVQNLKGSVEEQRDDEAKALVRKLVESPEFSLTTEECSSCIDFDKVMALKERKEYQGFYPVDYLSIKVINASNERECTRENYPACDILTLIKKKDDFGTPIGAFVALCRQEFFGQDKYIKCGLGKIYASGKEIKWAIYS
ncbi:hypothetical protein HYW75_00810 [Candidatus Pacearchaeota archaeon]|nr:hypothetical protein [Candidatus Pacearchaeota archaeon]